MNVDFRKSIKARSVDRKKRCKEKGNSQSIGSACYICNVAGHHWMKCPVEKKRKESTAGKSEPQLLQEIGKATYYLRIL